MFSYSYIHTPTRVDSLSDLPTQNSLERLLSDSWLASQTGPYVMPGTYPSCNVYSNPSGFSAPTPRPPQHLSVPYATGSGSGPARQQQVAAAFSLPLDSGLFKQPNPPGVCAGQSAAGTPIASAHTPHSQLQVYGAALDEPSRSGTRTNSTRMFLFVINTRNTRRIKSALDYFNVETQYANICV